MKELYMCEKCGKTYEDYSECCDCERSHLEPDSFCDFLRPVYQEGSPYPKEVTLFFDKLTWDEDYEHRVHHRSFVTYKLSKVLGPTETAEVNRQYEEKEERQAREMAEWRARREAREAAEQAAKEAAEVEQEAVGG